MLSDRGIANGPQLHRQDGFTLIELLVVIVTATVIAGALFTILDVTLRSTTRTFTRVE